jgi:dTDP-4-amino-4,6-dideoxygalactose transaminase
LAKKVFDRADLAALERVLTSGRLNYVGGSVAREFEAQVAQRYGTKHAVAIHSAMAGLQASLAAAGVGEGDEVICDSVVPFGGYAVMYLHARPVFADVDPATHNVDPASVRERITPRTKALVVTHLWGLPAKIEEVMAIAREHKLAVIEDCAHALFAERSGRVVGTFGTAGVLSFQQSKHMTTGDGGAVVTDDPYIVEQIRNMLAFGAKAPRLSWNFRMNELTAAVAGVQFARADGYVEEDRRAAQLYADAVAGHRALRPQATDGDASRHAYHLWVATYEGERTMGVEQSRFEQLCQEEGLEQMGFGYLQVPIYLHPEFSLGNAFGYDVWRTAGYCPYRRGYCPVAEDLMPRFLRVNISTRDYDEHARNAEALHRALRRLDK